MNDKILICEMLKTPTDAFLKFKQENCRFPGDCDDTELESDKQNILSSINRNIAEPYVEVYKETYYRYNILTLIRESWKKIQNAGPSPSVFCGKKIQSAALNQFVYVSKLWIFFFGNHAQ